MKTSSVLPPDVLDTATLGRPVHLLERFTQPLHDELMAQLRTRLNQRYRARFELAPLQMRRRQGPLDDDAWIAFQAGPGLLYGALERPALLAVLAYRYGLTGDAASDTEPRETATEERLAQQLLGQFLGALMARALAAGEDPTDTPAGPTLLGRQAPGADAWIIETRLYDAQLQRGGSLRLALDGAWMALLWQQLARRRARPAAAAADPLATRLTLTLHARLLQKQLALGDVADLRVGDLIPVSLGAADVLIDDSRLFNAAVAEHQGKLCLTSFVDVE